MRMTSLVRFLLLVSSVNDGVEDEDYAAESDSSVDEEYNEDYSSSGGSGKENDEEEEEEYEVDDQV